MRWDTPEDYDIEVFRKNADGSLGDRWSDSGNTPGKPEQVILSGEKAAPGTYVLRVINFAAVGGDVDREDRRLPHDQDGHHRLARGVHHDLQVGGNVVRTRNSPSPAGSRSTRPVRDRGDGQAAKPKPKAKSHKKAAAAGRRPAQARQGAQARAAPLQGHGAPKKRTQG